MRTLRNSSFLAAVAALVLSACGGSEKEPVEPGQKPAEPVASNESKQPTPPPAETPPPPPEEKKPPEPTYTHGRFVWFEHYAKNDKEAEKSRKFYTELFGWSFSEEEMGGHKFNLIKVGENPIGLSATLDKKSPVKNRTYWMGYISVADVDAVAEAATSQGGKVVMPAMDLENVGRFATFQDPSGAVFGIVKSSRGDMQMAMPKTGEFGWMELWVKKAKEGDKLVGYYSAVIGYQGEPFEGAKDYTTLSFEGKMFAGINKAASPKAGGAWIPYVAVADVDAAVAQAKKLKGKVILPAKDIPNVGRVAVIGDPQGASIGVWAAAGGAPAEKGPAGDGE